MLEPRCGFLQAGCAQPARTVPGQWRRTHPVRTARRCRAVSAATGQIAALPASGRLITLSCQRDAGRSFMHRPSLTGPYPRRGLGGGRQPRTMAEPVASRSGPGRSPVDDRTCNLLRRLLGERCTCLSPSDERHGQGRGPSASARRPIGRGCQPAGRLGVGACAAIRPPGLHARIARPGGGLDPGLAALIGPRPATADPSPALILQRIEAGRSPASWWRLICRRRRLRGRRPRAFDSAPSIGASSRVGHMAERGGPARRLAFSRGAERERERPARPNFLAGRSAANRRRPPISGTS